MRAESAPATKLAPSLPSKGGTATVRLVAVTATGEICATTAPLAFTNSTNVTAVGVRPVAFTVIRLIGATVGAVKPATLIAFGAAARVSETGLLRVAPAELVTTTRN